MKNMILEHCRNNLTRLSTMTDTEHGVNIQYDAIIQAANRLFDLADHIEKL